MNKMISAIIVADIASISGVASADDQAAPMPKVPLSAARAASLSTVKEYKNGIFLLPEGESVLLNLGETDGKIAKDASTVISFPKQGPGPEASTHYGAIWPSVYADKSPPGAFSNRAACPKLAKDEYEIVVGGYYACVRQGLSFNNWKDFSPDPSPGSYFTGGCDIDVLKIDETESPRVMVLRADCSPVDPVDTNQSVSKK